LSTLRDSPIRWTRSGHMKDFSTIMRDRMLIHIILLPIRAQPRASRFTSSRA
jgi:hypothetical protein